MMADGLRPSCAIPGSVLEGVLQNGRFRSNFTSLQAVGRGAFGAVYSVHHTESQCVSAVKVVPLSLRAKELNSLGNNFAFREVLSTLSDLNPKHVVQLQDHWLEEPQFLPENLEESCLAFWEPTVKKILFTGVLTSS